MSQPPQAEPPGGVSPGVPPPLYAIPISPPLPQAPMAPIPVQPLDLAIAHARRPGIITAMGVVSIVVASLTIVSIGVQGLQTFVMSAIARTTARAAALKAQTTALATPPVDDAGMADDTERQTTLQGLLRARNLPPTRRAQLDALLLKGGRQMFPFRGTQVTEGVIASNVSDSGRKYADDGNGADFYMIGKGEIEVYDTHAVFYPDDGAEMISAAVATDDDSAGIGATTLPAPGSLAPPAVQVPPAPGPMVTPAPATVPTFDRGALGFLMIERLLSLGLAIFLLVVGIMTLRQNPGGRRWHRIYAFAKIPLALVGGWLTWRLWFTFLGSSGGGTAVLATWITIWTTLALLYPLILLIVLQAQSVRDYYDSVTPPAS